MAKGYALLDFQYQQEEKDNVVNMSDFKLITGGKDGASGGGNCWLDDLPVGSVFTVQDKMASQPSQQNYFNLGVFKVGGRDGKVTYLQSMENPKGEPVNPVRFCNRFDLYLDITGYVVAKQIEEEGATNERDRLQGDPGVSVPQVDRPAGE